MSQILAFLLYLSILILIGVLSFKKGQSSDDFMLGSRKMNFYLTAFAAHASDMSSWIFLAYPAAIYLGGLRGISIAIGLTSFMFLNWQFIAPKIRTETEKYGSLTLSSFFESRFSDSSGILRIFSSLACIIFFTVYISGGLVSLGVLLNTIFSIPYFWGVILGIFVIIPYLFIGGYVTLAWTDCFQGIFLLCVILLVPISAFYIMGISFESLSFISTPRFLPIEERTWYYPILEIFAWGLPYFGLPHVLTKFMGISDVKEMKKAKWVGISWQVTALAGATIIGFIAKTIYTQGSINPEYVFIQMTTTLFPAFLATFILCAILGATITCMDSQILVVATSLAEDIYKKVIRKDATSAELLLVTRLSIFAVAILSCIIALVSGNSIMSLVSYSWFGLGASFSPLVLFSLFGKRVSRNGAAAGLFTGCFIAAIWPLFPFAKACPSMIPAFLLSCLAIKLFSIQKPTTPIPH
ncbi:MAG: High-affinity proline transporter PutP [Chlamydiia bacterium]|nr:High-affinity proline transporter PutP [Chlamydiia bacterium]MCH9618255.1 High-affinity proline transporter PutP [Chlamydiia bacterium]MCH9624651.1 High-affinity proline transporter PutP [Chlamydiia bacterium]